MERYNYELLRSRLLAKLVDEDWLKMPLKRPFMAQAEIVGVPLANLRNLVRLQPSSDGIDSEWIDMIADSIEKAGIDDHDRLDHVLLLRQFEPVGLDPLTKEPIFEAQYYNVVVVHLHNTKMAQLAGVTFFDAGRPPKLVYSKTF